MVFKVKSGVFTSSNKYSNRSDGRAIKIKMIPGKIVQIVSISCPCKRNRFVYLFIINIINMYKTNDKIIVKIRRVWSWKKISCSIKGEALFWNNRLALVAISYLISSVS